MLVVLAHKEQVRQCVSKHLERYPDTRGRLVLRWEIETEGQVSEVGLVSDEFTGTYAADCLMKLVETWRFPRHRTRGEPLMFPFLF